jgi:hypothetical protein
MIRSTSLRFYVSVGTQRIQLFCASSSARNWNPICRQAELAGRSEHCVAPRVSQSSGLPPPRFHNCAAIFAITQEFCVFLLTRIIHSNGHTTRMVIRAFAFISDATLDRGRGARGKSDMKGKEYRSYFLSTDNRTGKWWIAWYSPKLIFGATNTSIVYCLQEGIHIASDCAITSFISHRRILAESQSAHL